MKSMYLLVKGLTLLSLVTSVVKADHTGETGSVAHLQGETRELQSLVQASWLNYNVKDSVYRFSSDVDRLVYCIQQSTDRNASTRDHNGEVDHHTEEPGCPSQCSYYLNNANNSFRYVSNYLYDTYNDFPQIYYQWRETDNSLRAIHVTNPGPGPGPGPQPQTYRCVAVDTGWEEHSGGHVAYGNSIYSAQNNALYQCKRFHGACRISSCQ